MHSEQRPLVQGATTVILCRQRARVCAHAYHPGVVATSTPTHTCSAADVWHRPGIVLCIFQIMYNTLYVCYSTNIYHCIVRTWSCNIVLPLTLRMCFVHIVTILMNTYAITVSKRFLYYVYI